MTKYPSKELNRLVSRATLKFQLKEANYINAFGFFVEKTSGTLYNELRSCFQKEALEYSILLRTQFLAKSLVPNSFVQKFYELLKQYNYRPEDEILKCIKDIAVWHGEENIKFWEKTPWIKNVNVSGSEFTVKSGEREYSFEPTCMLYAEEIEDIKRKGMQTEKIRPSHTMANGYNPDSYTHLDYKCHGVSYYFSMLHPESYAVTAICSLDFNGLYEFHSYNVSSDFSSVIDLSYGIKMPYKDYIKLRQPIVLCQTKGEEIPYHLEEVRNSSWSCYADTKNSPLRTLAFYSYDAFSEEQREEKYGDLIRNLSKLK